MMGLLWMKKVGCRFIYVGNNRMLDINSSIQDLEKLDPSLKALFDSFEIDNLQSEKNYFKSIVRSIIYQQLSSKAARIIYNRFVNLFSSSRFPRPNEVIKIPMERMRSAGLSTSKAHYINNVSNAFIDNPDIYNQLEKDNDKDIIKSLMKIKGVGMWTAQMFLIFTLNRPDVFPVTDLGIQKGYRYYFKLNDFPNAETMMERAKIWIPHRTVVSLYLWRILEGPFEW